MSFHSTESTDALSEADLRGVRVLVAEDAWQVARALKALLNDLGMEVVGPAATLLDAEHLAIEHWPEMAVIDINLRGEMAYALIDRLHSQGVRVVVITGYAVLPHATKKIAVILEKPFSASALVAALRQAALSSAPASVENCSTEPLAKHPKPWSATPRTRWLPRSALSAAPLTRRPTRPVSSGLQDNTENLESVPPLAAGPTNGRDN